MLMRARAAGQSGVSLIEMVFTVALLAVLLSAAVPSFAGWLERNRVRASAESIHVGMQLARAEAVARNARVRFTLQADGSWAIACTATAPGCPDTTALHQRSGDESRGSFGMSVNSVIPDGATGLTFGAQGRPDASEAARIMQVDVVAAADIDEVSSSRALRITASDFGRTRLCYPYASTGSPTRC